MILFFWLVFGHALADYPLQGDFLAGAKRRLTNTSEMPWQWALTVHALIHAGFVLYFTSSPVLALLEWGLHVIIDFEKCEGRFGTGKKAHMIDQSLHILCKLLYVLLIARGI